MAVKQALVTGASEGIGLAIARRLAAAGYGITGVARSADRLREAMAGLPGTASHTALTADLLDTQGRSDVAEALKSRHYDVVVNNAGIGCNGDFAASDLEQQLNVLRLNCEALVALSHAYLQVALAGDALMNVSSVLAFAPTPGLGVYAATKAFVTSFSETLWYEQRPRGVFVTALHPGLTTTDFQLHAGGQTRSGPSVMAQSPDAVAAVAVKALHARTEPCVVSGARNAAVTGIIRLLPRRSLVDLMGKINGSKR